MKPETTVDAPLKFAVRPHGQFLATRSSGRSVREELEDQVTRRHPEEVVIDFTGVVAMTISFADEFLGRLYTSLAAGDLPAQAVLLLGLKDDTEETVAICLERRGLAAAAAINGHPALLGAPEHLVETYRHALELGSFSALDLAIQLSISAQNANNRLKQLVMARAIQRQRVPSDRGGKEFAYTVPPVLVSPVSREHAP
jgi:hypothetical protein